MLPIWHRYKWQQWAIGGVSASLSDYVKVSLDNIRTPQRMNDEQRALLYNVHVSHVVIVNIVLFVLISIRSGWRKKKHSIFHGTDKRAAAKAYYYYF